MARALPRRDAPPWAPTTVWPMPNRSSSPTVWANSREVTVTSWPRARMRAINGRKITAWGEFVMSTQTRTGRGSLGTIARAMRILVTDGTGFVGCHTVAALREAGHEVRLLVRKPERLAPALEPVGVDPDRMDAVVGDVTDAALVREAVAGCNAVVHVAGVWSLDPRRAGEIQRVNAPGTENVLSAAAEAGLDPIVHVSSYSALLPRRSERPLDGGSPVGAPPGPYAASKAASEAVARGLQDEGAPVAITYPGMVWGPHDPHVGETSRLALQVLAGRLPLLLPGPSP
jgi:dihydroflavonol-4-reductase